MVNASTHAKCLSLTNQKFTTQTTLNKLHPNEYTQGLRYCTFAVNLNRCVGSCNTLNDLLIKCSKQNRRFKSKRVRHHYRNQLIKNINKA